jgi:hypothetical protein
MHRIPPGWTPAITRFSKIATAISEQRYSCNADVTDEIILAVEEAATSSVAAATAE